MSTSAQRRQYKGLAVLSRGYRPFFLGAAVWAVVSMLLWVFSIAGVFELPSAFSPADWHIHEMIFGYSGAIIAGFLLTAVPNWTGRLPIMGNGLLLLFSLWLLGRVAILFSAFLHPHLVMAVDLSFSIMLIFVIAREIIVGKNWRNLSVLMVLVFLFIANLLFHIEMMIYGEVNYPSLLGLSVVLVVIMLIGGRVIPSFTRNWLMRFGIDGLPVSKNRIDDLAMIISIFALIAMVFLEQPYIVAGLLVLAGLLNVIRLARWAGHRTLSEPIVFVLHVGYSFVPLGFFALASFILWPDVMPKASAFHVWTAGAIGMMTIAMMTRVSLGHSGQKIKSDKIIVAIYISMFASIILRFAADFLVQYEFILNLSATLWIVAYLLFLIRYWKMLTS